MSNDTPHPRKKSRFFANGKSKIGSLMKGSKDKKDNDDTEESKDNSDGEDNPPRFHDVHAQYISAARGVPFVPLGRSTKVELPVRITNTASKSLINDRDQERLLSSSTHQKHTGRSVGLDELALRYRRCESVQGVQDFGLPVTEAPSSSFGLTLSAVTCPGDGDHQSQPMAHDPTTEQPELVATPFRNCSRTSKPASVKDEAPPSERGQLTEYARPPKISTQHRLFHTFASIPRNPHQLQQPSSNSLHPGTQENHITNSFDPFAGFKPANSDPFQGTVLSNPAHQMPDDSFSRTQSRMQWLDHVSSLPASTVDQTPSVLLGQNRQELLGRAQLQTQTMIHKPVDQFVAQNDQQASYPSTTQQTHLTHSLLPPHQPLPTQAQLNMDDHDVAQVLPGSCSDQVPPASHASLFGRLVNNTLLDLDRDATGALLPPRLRRFASQVSSRPIHVRGSVHKFPTTPANFYTSPKRIEHAIETSSLNLKRKRCVPDSQPPAYIYVRSDDPDFNIFSNGFLLYPELCIALTSQMPLRDLISLYSISKDFHTIVDSRFTTTCLAQVLRKAPQSAQTFQFRAYAQYCRLDPTNRIPHPNPTKAALKISRRIPSLRWVAFVLHREKVVHEIMTIFAEKGCPLPARCSLALKRMWMLMDIPDNARRVAIIHNHRLFTDLDLYFLMCFFVKLDMVANDPLASQKRDGLRKLLLTQPEGLFLILKVLKREMWKKRSDFMIAWVRTMMSLDNFPEERLNEMNVQSVFGIPRDQVGIRKYEYWGLKGVSDESTRRKRRYLLRPDQLVMREAIRRGLRFTNHFLRCVLYGYVRPDTLENYAPRKYGRRVGEWRDEDYEINDSIGGVRALAFDDGGDPLLDLGDTSRGSKYTIQKELVNEQERAMRQGQKDFLEGLYHASRQEQLHRMGRIRM